MILSVAKKYCCLVHKLQKDLQISLNYTLFSVMHIIFNNYICQRNIEVPLKLIFVIFFRYFKIITISMNSP